MPRDSYLHYQRVPDSTVEDSTVEDSKADLYFTTTLRRSFYQNADSTADREKMRTLRQVAPD